MAASDEFGPQGSPLWKRAGAAALWVLIVLEWLGMGVAGLAKFQGDLWIEMFLGWGYPAWFALFIGGAEVVFATLLLIPRLTTYAAVPLIVIMVGAIQTVLTNEAQLGPRIPAVHIAILALLAWARRSRRWRPRRDGVGSGAERAG